jgi:hypothetical protein
MSGMCIISGTPLWDQTCASRYRDGIDKIFDKTITDNFSSLEEKSHETFRNPADKIKKRNSPRHIIVKTLYI